MAECAAAATATRNLLELDIKPRDIMKVSARMPLLSDFKPSGPYVNLSYAHVGLAV
jgi:hypothetical protein